MQQRSVRDLMRIRHGLVVPETSTLREVAERQELARRTLEARRRPEVLALLDEHFWRLTLIDPARTWTVAPERLRTKSKNTPFLGQTVKGMVMLTLVAGAIAFDVVDSR